MRRSTLWLAAAVVVALALYAVVSTRPGIDPELEASVHPDLRPLLLRARQIADA